MGRAQTMNLNDHDRVQALVATARTNHDALPFIAQLLGVPPCPKCDYVKRDGELHFCHVNPVTENAHVQEDR